MVQLAAGAHGDGVVEAPQLQGVDVEGAADLGIGVVEDLEAVVEQEPLVGVGADPTPDPVGGLEDRDLEPGAGQLPGAPEPGQTRPHHDHVHPVHPAGLPRRLPRRLPWTNPDRCASGSRVSTTVGR